MKEKHDVLPTGSFIRIFRDKSFERYSFEICNLKALALESSRGGEITRPSDGWERVSTKFSVK